MVNRMMMKAAPSAVCFALLFALCLCRSTQVSAEAALPAGIWETIDDKTHKATSHVQIWERAGKLSGKITKLTEPDSLNPVCDACKGNRKNQPLIGMVIMWGLTRGDNGWWEGGHILDPDNGKTYRCKIKLTHGGRKLDVRGYIGISLFGRTQTWNRER
jgi:uncharacterized protein (DUF2147 family)